MADNDNMVLRTFYLPPGLDEKLRVHAFRSKVTKNELIRSALERQLAKVTDSVPSARRAASENVNRMVLRTVYLPPALDDQLRTQAFEIKGTKNDLIRLALEQDLAKVPAFGQDGKTGRAKPLVRKTTSKRKSAAVTKAVAG